jgi:hypothetical protein
MRAMCAAARGGWRYRSQEVMGSQALALRRLRRLVGGLGLLQLVFCAGALVLQDTYLLTGVAEQRMGFMDRTVGYFQNSFWACFALRDLQLLGGSGSSAVGAEAAARGKIRNSATTMLDIHSLNYISPPSWRVSSDSPR